LAAVTTGEWVFRENAIPGAVLARVASSHIRVGTFQFFAARQDVDGVRALADYVIARHYPEANDETVDGYRYKTSDLKDLRLIAADMQADADARAGRTQADLPDGWPPRLGKAPGAIALAFLLLLWWWLGR
jgi:hypothetical protein